MISWNKFITCSNVKNLCLNEQKRLYYLYQNDYYWRNSSGSKPIGNNINEDLSLLQESEFFLLQENELKILL